MRWFAPVADGAAAAPARAGLLDRVWRRTAAPVPVERLGGVPFGLRAELWPRYGECGHSQSLLAQLRHDPERLDLGREGRMLFVFQCGHDPGMCETWAFGSGANAAFVVEPEQLGGTDTPVPGDCPPLEPHLVITGWTARDDGIAEADRARYLDDDALGEMTDEERDRPVAATRLGSVPIWIQRADEAPAGWRFVGQLDSTDDATCPAGASPNFGDAGIAYLFLRDARGAPPEAGMFWQCG